MSTSAKNNKRWQQSHSSIMREIKENYLNTILLMKQTLLLKQNTLLRRKTARLNFSLSKVRQESSRSCHLCFLSDRVLMHYCNKSLHSVPPPSVHSVVPLVRVVMVELSVWPTGSWHVQVRIPRIWIHKIICHPMGCLFKPCLAAFPRFLA